jgi:Homeodomain-like domain
MTFKDVAVKKYVVRLSSEEREYLDQLIRKGKSPALKLMKARILLKADVGKGGEGWSDSRIIEALGTSPSMLYRVRKQLVEEGFEAVLSRKQRATPAVPKLPGKVTLRAGQPDHVQLGRSLAETIRAFGHG